MQQNKASSERVHVPQVVPLEGVVAKNPMGNAQKAANEEIAETCQVH